MIRFFSITTLIYSALIVFSQMASGQAPLQRMVISEFDADSPSVSLDYPDQAIVFVVSGIANIRFNSNMDAIVAQLSPTPGEYVLFVDPVNQILEIDAPGFLQLRYPLRALQARSTVSLSVEPQQQSTDRISVIFNVQPLSADLYVNGNMTETNQVVQLPPGEKEIRIERAGYQTISDQITISERNIQFNYMMQETEDIPVLFEINNPGATVFINGQERGRTDSSGSLGLWLFPGTYEAEVRLAGFLTHVTEIEVSSESNNRFSIQLERNVGELILQTTPSDASVFINRQEYGIIERVDLPPGLYRLEIVKEGFEPYLENLEITLNEQVFRNIHLTPHTGSLRFTISPAIARVYLQDSLGNTIQEWTGFQQLRNLQVGDYLISAYAEGYLTLREEIHIKKDDITITDITMVEGTGMINTEINGDICGLNVSLRDWYNVISRDVAVRSLGIPPDFTTFVNVLNTENRIRIFHNQLLSIDSIHMHVPSEFEKFYPCFK